MWLKRLTLEGKIVYSVYMFVHVLFKQFVLNNKLYLSQINFVNNITHALR